MNADVEKRLLEAIAGGMSVSRFCHENPDAPMPQAVFERVTRNPEFRLKHMAARMLAADLYIDQVIDIADSNQDPKKSKLQIETRWRLASILNPAAYGEKLDVTVTERLKGASPAERIDQIIAKITAARALPAPESAAAETQDAATAVIENERPAKWSVLD